MVTLFYQTAIDHVYFYKIEFAKLIIRYHRLTSLEVYFMARKKDTPQKAALREMMGNYLKENNVTVKDGTDVDSVKIFSQI